MITPLKVLTHSGIFCGYSFPISLPLLFFLHPVCTSFEKATAPIGKRNRDISGL